jgi:hypothetical protein
VEKRKRKTTYIFDDDPFLQHRSRPRKKKGEKATRISDRRSMATEKKRQRKEGRNNKQIKYSKQQDQEAEKNTSGRKQGKKDKRKAGEARWAWWNGVRHHRIERQGRRTADTLQDTACGSSRN